MMIQRVEAYEVTLRYNEPFVISTGSSVKRRNIVLRIVTDEGLAGWGEASPSHRVTKETPETVLNALDKIGPNLIGMDSLRVGQNIDQMDRMIADSSSAKASVDIALHDILGKTVGRPLWRLLGGFRDRVLTDITLSLKSPDQMAGDAVRAVERGFKALKIKVGLDPRDDIERVRLIREAVGKDVSLRIDANEGWTVRQALEVLGKLERYDIEFAEQPTKSADIRGLSKIKRKSLIPIMADESVHSPADALRLIKEDSINLINIKLMKSGGIGQAIKIVAIAEAANIPCMIGCMGESAIGISAAVHFAAASKNVRFADLDSDILLMDRLVAEGGPGLDNSERILTDGPGLGDMKLNLDLLGKPVKVYGN